MEQEGQTDWLITMIALMRSLDKVICTNQKVIEINGTTEMIK